MNNSAPNFQFQNQDFPKQETETKPQKNSNARFILLGILILAVIGVGAYFFLWGNNSSSEADLTVTDATDATLANDPTLASTSDSMNSANPTASTNVMDNIAGVTVGGLFIPAAIDDEAVEFLGSRVEQGKFPIDLSQSQTGKTNPFSK